VTITYKEQSAKGSVKVLADPRMLISDQDRQAKWDAVQKGGRLQETATDAIERVVNLRADIDFVLGRAGKMDKDELKSTGAKESSYKILLDAGRDLKKEVDAVEKLLRVPPKTKGIPPENDAWSKIEYPHGMLRLPRRWTTCAKRNPCCPQPWKP
jgi:hypothetical protein